MLVQTTFAGGVNPFILVAESKRLQAEKRAAQVLAEKQEQAAKRLAAREALAAKRLADKAEQMEASRKRLAILDARSVAREKRRERDAKFAKLRMGSGFSCEPEKVESEAELLRKWMRRNGVKGTIRTTKNYPGTKTGHVWLRQS